MRLPIYQVDAFADELYKGNPAAVCPLKNWIPDHLMQSIAAENNLAETAFFVETENGFHLRWFTPKAEVDLCGHATLAAAHVLFEHLEYAKPEVNFTSKSGPLSVTRDNGLLTLNFPMDSFQEVEIPTHLISSFDFRPIKVLKGSLDYVFIYRSQSVIEHIRPNLEVISKADSRGIIATAPGDQVDFVSRYFAPQFGIPEDPVTGSAHTILTPYWSREFGRNDLKAKQLSPRGGSLSCSIEGDRVKISGKAITYMKGELI